LDALHYVFRRFELLDGFLYLVRFEQDRGRAAVELAHFGVTPIGRRAAEKKTAE
jgi:hypothetical protein